MTEDDFARELYPRVGRASRVLARRVRYVMAAEDLAQHGMMEAVALYRQHGGPPPLALAMRAARCGMIDAFRTVCRAAKRRPGNFTGSLDEWTSLTAVRGYDQQETERLRRFSAERLISRLKERDQRIIKGLLRGETLGETGAVLGITHGRVAQRRKRILEILAEGAR